MRWDAGFFLLEINSDSHFQMKMCFLYYLSNTTFVNDKALELSRLASDSKEVLQLSFVSVVRLSRFLQIIYMGENCKN